MYSFRTLIQLFAAALLASFAVTAVSAQPVVVPFTITVRQGSNTNQIENGGTISMSTDAIGQSTTARVTISYTGAASVVFNAIQPSGAGDFTLTAPATPFTVGAGQSVDITVKFTASGGKLATGKIGFSFVEGSSTTSGTFSINLAGTTADFVLTTRDSNGNATLLSDGSTIAFKPTPINTSATYTVTIANNGSGPGNVNTIAVTGASYQLLNQLLQLPGASIDPGNSARFNVQFTPTQLGTATGTLTVEFPSRKLTFQLTGSGTAPVLAYQLLQDSNLKALLPADTVAFGDTSIGTKKSVTVTVQNTGNADAVITDFGVSGPAFALSNPPFTPLTIHPQASASFGLDFTPTQPGPVTGRFRVGTDSFNLTGNGIGAALSFNYLSGGNPISIQVNDSVIFTPTAVGLSASTRFTISNSGNSSTVISSIGVDTSKVYSVASVPSLPVTLAPASSISFTIGFAPNNLGILSGVLHVDSRTFNLSGSGSSPSPLPTYRFSGASGPQDPTSQPTLSLTLDSPYTLPVVGTLRLAFDSDVFVDDPTIQFATGGRTVGFTIPANSTQAIFDNNTSQIKFQAGTVAGTITLTPVFNTEAGLSLTPASPPVLKLTVPSSAPRILSTAIDTKVGSSFTLTIVGLATGRDMNQMNFQFNPVSGLGLSIPAATANVAQTFSTWYQSATSQPFGSLFTATVPFSLSGQIQNTNTLLEGLQSITVALANREGTSAPATITLR